MVEDDGAEVSTVVMGDEVLGGEGALQAACSDALVLQQRLIQSKQHLQGNRETDRQEGRCYFLHLQTRFSQEEFAMRMASVPLLKYNVTLTYNEAVIPECRRNVSCFAAFSFLS